MFLAAFWRFELMLVICEELSRSLGVIDIKSRSSFFLGAL